MTCAPPLPWHIHLLVSGALEPASLNLSWTSALLPNTVSSFCFPAVWEGGDGRWFSKIPALLWYGINEGLEPDRF